MKITIRKLKSLNACRESIEEYQKIGKELDHKEVFKLLINKSELVWANWLITQMLNKNNCIKYAMYAVRAANTDAALAADAAVSARVAYVYALAREASIAARYAASYAASAHAGDAANARFAAAFAGGAAARARSALVAAMAVVHPTADEDTTALAADAAVRIKIIKYGLRLFNKQENKL